MSKPRFKKVKRAREWVESPSVDVWVCMNCGLAFPRGHQDLVASGTVCRHWTCVAIDGSRTSTKHVGMLSVVAASALCGPRFQRRDIVAVTAPAAAMKTPIGQLVKLVPSVAPTAVQVPPVGPACGGCGESLIEGACPMNTPEWPHEIERATITPADMAKGGGQ